MTEGGMAFDDTGISWPEPDGKPTCMDCQVPSVERLKEGFEKGLGFRV